MKRIIPILIAILICFSVGCTASSFQSESILNWYPALEKPSCTPPDIAFPIAWSFIYHTFAFPYAPAGIATDLRRCTECSPR